MFRFYRFFKSTYVFHSFKDPGITSSGSNLPMNSKSPNSPTSCEQKPTGISPNGKAVSHIMQECELDSSRKFSEKQMQKFRDDPEKYTKYLKAIEALSNKRFKTVRLPFILPLHFQVPLLAQAWSNIFSRSSAAVSKPKKPSVSSHSTWLKPSTTTKPSSTQ